MSCSETVIASSPNKSIATGQDHNPGEDRDRAVGVKAAHLAAPIERECREAREDLVALGGGEHVPVHPGGVVRLEVLGDRRQ